MEQQSAYLELTIISAADLKRGWFSGEETSALAWVDPSAKKWTSIVNCDGSNVQWPHQELSLSLGGDDNASEGKLLTIEIYSRGILGVSLLGSVYVPLADLVPDGETRGKKIWMYEIVQPSGNQEGSLKFLAHIVQPGSSDTSSVQASSRAAHLASPTRSHEDESSKFKAQYPSPIATRAVELNNEGRASEKSMRYARVPQVHTNASTRHDSLHHGESAEPSRGLDSCFPLVYPSVDADYASHTPQAPRLPHSSYTSNNIPHPHPHPHPDWGTSHPPPAFVYPHPTAYAGPPYPSGASHPQCPQMIPQHPYSSCAHPFFPPSHVHQPATIHYP